MSTSKVYIKHLKNYRTLIYHIECLRPLIQIPNLIIQFSTMVQEVKLGQKWNSNKTSQIAITGTGKEESEVIKFAIDWAPS